MKFVIQLSKCSDPEAFQAAVPEHIQYMQQLHDDGILIAAGPFMDAKGGMVIIDVVDEVAAHDVARNDPFIQRRVETYTLRHWQILTPVRPESLTRDDLVTA